MAADAWVVYNKAKEYIGDGTIDLDDATAGRFRCILVTSSYTPAATHSTYNDIGANEVAEANGYLDGGFSLTPTWTESSGTVTWDASTDPNWTASGGSITARYAVIVRAATAGTAALATGDYLIAYCLLDNSPADVVQADGGTLTITLNASGIFTLA